MCYVVQVYVNPSVFKAKGDGKVTITSDRGCSPVRKAKGSATLSLIGKTVGDWRHVACCRANSDILHDLLA